MLWLQDVIPHHELKPFKCFQSPKYRDQNCLVMEGKKMNACYEHSLCQGTSVSPFIIQHQRFCLFKLTL